MHFRELIKKGTHSLPYDLCATARLEVRQGHHNAPSCISINSFPVQDIGLLSCKPN